MNYTKFSTISKKFLGIALLASVLVAPQSSLAGIAASQNPPVILPLAVSTLPPSQISETGATLNGSYTLNSASSAIVWFQYGTTPSMLTSSTQPTIKTASGGIWSTNIGGLTAGTTYYFKAFASYNGSTTGASNIVTFKTVGGQNTANQVSTLPPSAITTTSADLNSYVQVQNPGTYTLIFKWNTSDSALTNILSFGNVSGQSGQKTKTLTGLTPNTQYSYKACLRDSNGTDQCGPTQITFTTLSNNTNPTIYECNDGIDNDGDGKTDYPTDAGCTSSTDDSENSEGTPCTSNCGGNTDGEPNAITLSASDVEEDEATLRGEIDPNGEEVDEVWFEYGEDEDDLDEEETVDEDDYDNDDTDSFDVEFTIDNLDEDTEYFFRVCARNSYGEDCGSIKSFTTDDSNRNDNNNDDDDNDYIHESPQVIPRIIYKTTSVGSTSSKIMLSIDTRFDNAYSGDTIDYVVAYKNTSGLTLTHAILHIEFPKEVIFRRANEGHYNKKDHTLTLDLGTLSRGEGDEIVISVRADSSIQDRTELVTKATLAFTMPNTAQENAIAYAITKVSDSRVSNGSALAGTALFGGDGFLPDSLIEWLILIILMALIIAGFRYYKHKEA
jgi:hypothetical protein